MRETKYKAWHKKEKRIFDVTHIDFFHRFISERSGTHDHGVLNGYSFDDCELIQYTGLKDKNGKEIYEGDILNDDCGDKLEIKFGELPLDKSGDCVCTYHAFYCKNHGQLGKSPCYECQDIGDWMEIIGTIYENPELLK